MYDELGDFGTTHGQLAIETLSYVANYGRLHDNLSWFISDWRQANPAIDSVVHPSALNPRRLRDQERVRWFVEIAHSLGTSADVSNVKAVAHRVKDVRDHVAHPTFIFAMEHKGEPAFGFPHYSGEKRLKSFDGQSSTINLSFLRKRRQELDWLLEVEHWVATEAAYFGGPGELEYCRMSVPPRVPPRSLQGQIKSSR